MPSLPLSEGVALPTGVSWDEAKGDEGLWHARTCHASPDRLRQAAQVTKGMVVTKGGLQVPCAACVEGKLKRRPFLAAEHRATKKLQEAHTDLIGKMPLQSRNKKWYAVVVVDDFSRFSWVFCIFGKSDAADTLLKWWRTAERHSGERLLYLRLDEGREFLATNFVETLEGHGVTFRPTVPHTPQHNSVVERTNGVLVDMARTALHAAGLTLYWWEYAIKHANWVRNRLPTRANAGKTPYELWHGEQPSLAMAKPFGCMAQYWIPKQGEQGGSKGRKKWDAKARWGMLVGIPEDTQGWSLWDPELDAMRTACHVVFYEKLFYRAWKQGDAARNRCPDFPDAPWPLMEDEEELDALEGVQAGHLEEGNLFPLGGGQDQAEEHLDLMQETTYNVRDIALLDDPDDGEGLGGNDDAAAYSLPPAQQQYRRRKRVQFEEPVVDEDTRPVTRLRVHVEGAKEEQAAASLPSDNLLSQLNNTTPAEKEIAATTQVKRSKLLEVRSFWTGMTLISVLGEWVTAMAALPDIPRTMPQALSGPDRVGWKAAADKEYTALVNRDTWVLVLRPKGRNVITTKWVFTIKTKPDGTFDRYKARLVARGFRQRLGLDYGETYAPVGRYATARVLLAVGCSMDWEIHVMDVSNAFLYGDIEEDIYVEQPEGYNDGTGRVCKMRRALYGLKQSPRQWNKRLHEQLLGLGFHSSAFDPALYLRYSPRGGVTFLLVYVDDILMVCSDPSLLSELKQQLLSTWDMKDLGEIAYYLGLNVHRDRRPRKLWVSQPKYITGLINRYDFDEQAHPPTPLPSGFKHILEGEADKDCKDVGLSPLLDKNQQRLYQSIIGALNFAAGCTRPDIAYAVSKLASVNHCPRKRHMPAAVRCLQYLAATPELSLAFDGSNGADSLTLRGASDSDWAGCPVTRRSTTGYVFSLAGGPVSWLSKRQSETALSSCQAEYVALTAATKEACWLRDLLAELGFPRARPTPIFVDNAAAVELSKNPKFHSRTKHIQLAFLYAREQQEKGVISVMQVKTHEQPADFLTKNVPAAILAECRHLVGMEFPPVRGD